MKYSDGFFIFRMEKTEAFFSNSNQTVNDSWVHEGDIENFNSYKYYWLIRDQKGFRSEFHEAPVWVNENREFIVIFLSNYQLVSQVINAASKKFGVNLIPLSLAKRSTIMNDGNMVITNKGTCNNYNKVKTTLLKNDQQRVSVIKSVLVGE
jgi:hypothetical protein